MPTPLEIMDKVERKTGSYGFGILPAGKYWNEIRKAIQQSEKEKVKMRQALDTIAYTTCTGQGAAVIARNTLAQLKE